MYDIGVASCAQGGDAKIMARSRQCFSYMPIVPHLSWLVKLATNLVKNPTPAMGSLRADGVEYNWPGVSSQQLDAIIHPLRIQPPVFHCPDGAHQHAVHLLAAVGDAGQADDRPLPDVKGAEVPGC